MEVTGTTMSPLPDPKRIVTENDPLVSCEGRRIAAAKTQKVVDRLEQGVEGGLVARIVISPNKHDSVTPQPLSNRAGMP